MGITNADLEPVAVPGDAETQTLMISLASIRRDERFQARENGVNPDVVAEYAEACRTSTLPPLRCVRIAGVLFLVDGFHTLEALLAIGVTEATVVVSEGTESDAFLLAAAANATHGVRRTPADTKRAVALALRGLIAKGEEAISNYRIAEIVGVGEATVRRYLPEIEATYPELCVGDAQRTAKSRAAVEREAGKAVEATARPPEPHGAREADPATELNLGKTSHDLSPGIERPKAEVVDAPRPEGDLSPAIQTRSTKSKPTEHRLTPTREPKEPEAADRTLAVEVGGRFRQIENRAHGLRDEVDNIVQFYASTVLDKMLARSEVRASWTAAITELRDCSTRMEAMLGSTAAASVAGVH